jgi:hypothetical protein
MPINYFEDFASLRLPPLVKIPLKLLLKTKSRMTRDLDHKKECRSPNSKHCTVPGPHFSSLHVLACGLDLVPNMFTDVSHYTDWIQKAMATANPRAR